MEITPIWIHKLHASEDWSETKKKNQTSRQLDHRTLLQTPIARNQFIRNPNRKPKQKKIKWYISIQTACTPAPCSQIVFFFLILKGSYRTTRIGCYQTWLLSRGGWFVWQYIQYLSWILDLRNSLQLSTDEMSFLLFKDPVPTAQ